MDKPNAAIKRRGAADNPDGRFKHLVRSAEPDEAGRSTPATVVRLQLNMVMAGIVVLTAFALRLDWLAERRLMEMATADQRDRAHRRWGALRREGGFSQRRHFRG